MGCTLFLSKKKSVILCKIISNLVRYWKKIEKFPELPDMIFIIFIKNASELGLNPPSVATDLRDTHDTSLGALPPLYSVESTHL